MSTLEWTRVEIAERMTAEEFMKWVPETQKAELIEGVMMMHSPASDVHEALFGFLFRLLGTYVEENDLGVVRGSRTAVELAPDEVFEPDILFVARSRRDIIQAKGISGAPDLVIEILSASTALADRGVKLRSYERAGVRELWLIDPYGPAGTEFYRLEKRRYQPVLPEPDGTLRSTSVSAFWLDVKWLWPQGGFVSVQDALGEIAAPKAG
jgi:Uma2 family endonuclease